MSILIPNSPKDDGKFYCWECEKYVFGTPKLFRDQMLCFAHWEEALDREGLLLDLAKKEDCELFV